MAAWIAPEGEAPPIKSEVMPVTAHCTLSRAQGLGTVPAAILAYAKSTEGGTVHCGIGFIPECGAGHDLLPAQWFPPPPGTPTTIATGLLIMPKMSQVTGWEAPECTGYLKGQISETA